MRALITALLLLPALAAGCNSYDPDLGAVPFRCGSDEPRCPLGYTCVSYSADEELCEKTADETDGDGDGDGDGAGEPDAGSGDFSCADDGEIEPNDGMGEATNTFIPSLHDTYKLVSLSICPDTDNDYFRFEVDVAGKNLRADLTYDAGRGQLLLEVKNQGGDVIRAGAAVDGMPGLVRAEVANLPVGTYFVAVRAAGTAENNYTIEIAVDDG